MSLFSKNKAFDAQNNSLIVLNPIDICILHDTKKLKRGIVNFSFYSTITDGIVKIVLEIKKITRHNFFNVLGKKHIYIDEYISSEQREIFNSTKELDIIFEINELFYSLDITSTQKKIDTLLNKIEKIQEKYKKNTRKIQKIYLKQI